MVSKKSGNLIKIAIIEIIVIALILGVILVINHINNSKQDINPQVEEQVIPDVLQNEQKKEISVPVKNNEPADKESVPQSDFKVPEIG